MKRFTVLFTLLVLVTICGATLAFKISKRSEIVTYYFTGAHNYIGFGINGLVSYQVTNTSNWTYILPTGYTLTNGNFLAGIEFDEEELSLTSAINEVWYYYTAAGNSLPTHNQYFLGGLYYIKILRKQTLN